MKRNKLINQLVSVSYLNGILDERIVNRIALKLNRKELKAYIHGLKEHEKRTTIRLEIAKPNITVNEEALRKIFGGKKIQTTINPDLLLGLRITDSDDVYNMNLKTSLERIEAYAAE